MKGLGDIIEAIIPKVLKPKNCEGCAERKEALNKKFPLPQTTSRVLRRSKRKVTNDG